MSKKVLLVDDEKNVLDGFKRHLRGKYDLHLGVGGQAALDIIKAEGPFAVVVSDMQMPEMSGLEFLKKVNEVNPQTVRMMLTGNADQKTAVDAVNESNIFRFLNKPCPPERLAQSIDAALEQYRLVTAEAELLSKTLSGSVRVLTQVLSLSMPDAFGMTQEARTLVREIATHCNAGPMWQVEIAAMLMRLGCVSLSPEVRKAYFNAEELSPEARATIEDTYQLGHDLIAEIPRLQAVADLVLHQNTPLGGQPPMTSRILRVVGDYQRFNSAMSVNKALDKLENDKRYDQEVVAALAEVLNGHTEIAELSIGDLSDGMVLEAHVEDASGAILLAAGTEIHESLIHKLRVFRQSGRGVREPIKVRILQCKPAPSPAATPATAASATQPAMA